jgi:hypothetical protein
VEREKRKKTFSTSEKQSAQPIKTRFQSRAENSLKDFALATAEELSIGSSASRQAKKKSRVRGLRDAREHFEGMNPW